MAVASVHTTPTRPLPDAADVQAIGCPTGCLLTVEEHLKIEQNEPDWSPAK